jgi:hypothetical protein
MPIAAKLLLLFSARTPRKVSTHPRPADGLDRDREYART